MLMTAVRGFTKMADEGWVDYFAPQLYCRSRRRNKVVPRVLKCGRKQNPKGRHIFPDWKIPKTMPRRRSGERHVEASEIVNQIE